jgi:hypothetical protein
MRSIGQGMSPQAAHWESNREAELANEALTRIRQELDGQEAEALATRRAEARRAQRQQAKGAVPAGR